MGVDVKSRTSTTLRIHTICKYTILRLLMVMFSFLAAMFSLPAVFLRSWRADGAFWVTEVGVIDIWNALHTKSLDGM